MAGRSLEEINLIRKHNGAEPLTELTKEEGGDNNGETPEQIEAKRKAEEEAAKKKNQPNNTEKTEESEKELDDAGLLALLQKRGITVSSLDELAPKEDAAVIAEKREAAKLSYGLDKGKVTKKQYENFIVDSRDIKNFVFGQYHADAKKEDAELTDDQIQEEFVAEFGMDADPNSRKYKYGQQKLALLADKMLKEKYSNVYQLDSEFSAYETDQNTKKETEKKVLSGAPIYTKDVNDVFDELKKITTKFEDGSEYEIEAAQESLDKIKQRFLDSKYASGQILKGYKKEDLKEIAYTTFLRENFPILVDQIYTQRSKQHQAGTKGILPAPGKTKVAEGDIDTSTLPEAAKQYRALNKKKETAAN